jgi:Zn-dependent membrane protease YugP
MLNLFHYYGGGTSYLWLIIVPIALVLLAQFLVTSTFKKYSKLPNHRGLTGLQVARQILDYNGLHNVQIFQGEGQLSDYFDPTKNIIKLSADVYGGTSVAALAVAAHEVGHAIQYAQKFPVIAFRNKVLPLAMTASNISWFVIFAGFVFASFTSLIYIGVGLLCVVALFQLLTLPLEYDASRRALKNLEDYHLLDYDEIPKAKKVLTFAALTYVVALLTTIAEIIRILLIARSRD